MNKRDFFKFLAVAPAVLPAAAIAKAREGDEPISESVKLVLHGIKKRDGEMMRLTSGGSISIGSMPIQDPEKQVGMAVGNDGHLWLKTKSGEWRRVVTE